MRPKGSEPLAQFNIHKTAKSYECATASHTQLGEGNESWASAEMPEMFFRFVCLFLEERIDSFFRFSLYFMNVQVQRGTIVCISSIFKKSLLQGSEKKKKYVREAIVKCTAMPNSI